MGIESILPNFVQGICHHGDDKHRLLHMKMKSSLKIVLNFNMYSFSKPFQLHGFKMFFFHMSSMVTIITFFTMFSKAFIVAIVCMILMVIVTMVDMVTKNITVALDVFMIYPVLGQASSCSTLSHLTVIIKYSIFCSYLTEGLLRRIPCYRILPPSLSLSQSVVSARSTLIQFILQHISLSCSKYSPLKYSPLTATY